MKRIVLFAALAAASVWAAQPVKLWEEPLVIPTYQIGAPDRYPMFYAGRAYQGARGMVYPYALYDKITDVKKDHAWHAVYLENQYVKVCVLPELGGRVFSAVDKTDNYDFIYHQHVIKPALIGMLGAWISGGIEYNVPHHHRASSYMPVDYRLEENADGSKTVWVGEIERRHRMKWLVGLTLYPDKSYVEFTVKVMNRTPFAHSMLYFANIAVHTNPDYQVVFPPRTQFVTHHSKVQFARWPVADSSYGGADFKGVDVSWWKNHPSSNSMFAWNYEDDFLAGYDHGKQAGTLHVADHGQVPGKKFFTWGTGPSGRMWDSMLTDEDGPYLELMVGAYSDNQPDYTWLQPGEVRTFKQVLYPFRQIGAVKNANREAAVNLEISGAKARVGFAATSIFTDARAVLKAGDKVLLDRRVTVGPAQPFATDVAVPAGTAPESLRAALYAGNRELVAYQVLKPRHDPMPDTVKPPAAPKDIPTNEELYLAGLRLEQFHSPASDPDPYYLEALRRDPGDYRANTAIGILEIQRGLFAEAEKHLRAAVDRATRNYTSTRDGEAYYYLGIARKYQDRDDEAWDPLYKATWSYAWRSPAYQALAEVASARGETARALEMIDNALATNALSTRARNLKAALLRHAGRTAEAAALAAATAAMDPLDLWAANELKRPLGGDVEAHLELAVDYASAGLWRDGAAVLSRYADPRSAAKVNPMVWYWLGWLTEKQGADAARYYNLAAKASPDYCFPYRLESIAVLRHAAERNHTDARAPYYLGNLLFDSQPKAAMAEWERAAKLDPAFPIAHRNLGLAYARVDRDVPKAVAHLEAALASANNDARLYYELDQLYEAAGVPAPKRLDLLASNHAAVANRDDALSRELTLLVQLGQYDRAIDLIANHHFHIWEGGGVTSVHDLYVDAHLLRGRQQLAAGKTAGAVRDFAAALAYPRNLEVAESPRSGRSPQIQYFLGIAQEAAGNTPAARDAFQKSASADARGPENLYYQGRACQKLGQNERAAGIFDGLVRTGKRDLESRAAVDYFAKFGERGRRQNTPAQAHFTVGLGLLGGGNTDEARAEFQKALELNPNFLAAQAQLAELR